MRIPRKNHRHRRWHSAQQTFRRRSGDAIRQAEERQVHVLNVSAHGRSQAAANGRGNLPAGEQKPSRIASRRQEPPDQEAAARIAR